MKPNPAMDTSLCEAALRLAAKEGWQKLTLAKIAKAAKINENQIQGKIKDINALLPMLVTYVSEQAAKRSGNPDRSAPIHDRLFEILMARFDVLQSNRSAFLSIAASAKRDARIAMILIPAQLSAVQSILKSSNLVTEKPHRHFIPLAIWGVYTAAEGVWERDETLDMSKTMAAVDRYLRCAAHTATLFRLDVEQIVQ